MKQKSLLRSMLLLFALIVGSVTMWGQAISTSDFVFPTPYVSEDFNSLSITSGTGNTSNATTLTNQTAFGVFDKIYCGKDENTWAIESNNTFGSKVLSLSVVGAKPLIASITGKTFGDTGAFSYKILKTNKCYVGLYKDNNGTILTHASSSVYIKNDAGTLSINDGSGWVSIGSYNTTIIEVCVVYNNSTSSATYGDEISLGSKKAHIYVNGNCVMNGSSPKAFSIPGAALTVFRVLPIDANGNKATIDDVKIYNSLPITPPAAPSFDIEGGNFSEAFNLTITGETGTTLKYTTDGSNPANATATSTNTAVVNIPAATTTVRAIAIKNGVSSPEKTATYTYVDNSKENPTFQLSKTSLNLKVNEMGEITLTTNSDGEISFSCPDNHLTIEQDDNFAVLSADAAGTYVVTVDVSASDTYNPASGTVTVYVTKKEPLVTINDELIENKNVRVSTNAGYLDASVSYNSTPISGATVTWSSSKTGVATIENSGKVTLVSGGTTRITANYAGNDEYEASSAYYDLTVIDPSKVVINFNDNDQNVSGNFDQASSLTYTIKGVKLEFSNSGSSGETNPRMDGATYTSGTKVARIYKNNTFKMTAPDNMLFKSITFDFGKGSLKIGSTTYSSTNTSWTGSSNIVQFTGNENAFVNSITITYYEKIPVSTYGLATYASDFDLDFTNLTGIEAYKAKVDGSNVTMTKVNVVPAGEGFLLKATETLDETTNFNVPMAATATEWADSDNDFIRGKGLAVPSVEGDVKNYILTTKSGVVGFYLAGGKVVATNRAYLSAPVTGDAPSLSFDWDEGTTAIQNIERTINDNQYYTLDGRRVAQPTKGLYILNGKKVIVK